MCVYQAELLLRVPQGRPFSRVVFAVMAYGETNITKPPLKSSPNLHHSHYMPFLGPSFTA